MILNRAGETFWQAESYTLGFVMSPSISVLRHLSKTLENNSVKAGLVERAEDFSWSSAHANERGVHLKKRLDTSVEAADTSVCATNLIQKLL